MTPDEQAAFAAAWDGGATAAAAMIAMTARVHALETALWHLTFALYDEKQGNSHLWTQRIRDPLIAGRGLVQHLDPELHPNRSVA